MLHEPPRRMAAAEAVPIDHTRAVVIETFGLRVESGTADLYLDWPGRAGRRRRFATLAPGEIALPIGVPPGAAKVTTRTWTGPVSGSSIARPRASAS